MGLLDDKVAIVTGAGNGIGRAHALLFASEGAAVVVNDVGGARDGENAGDTSPADAVVKEIEAAGGRAVASHDSVATAEGARAIVELGVETFGKIDVLVNNAGILRDKTFMKMDEAMWDSVIAVHLKGTFLVSQAFAKHAVNRGGGGRIVNTTSVSGMLGNFGQANYAAAKAGIYGLTRTLAIELQKQRITVNALAPIAKTRMTEDLPMFHEHRNDDPGARRARRVVPRERPLRGPDRSRPRRRRRAALRLQSRGNSAGKFKDGRHHRLDGRKRSPTTGRRS